MKVGDLVKVYHYSHEARKSLARAAERNPDRNARTFINEGVDGHYVGLIVATSDPDPKYRRVLRCVDGDWEDYRLNRLEVIA
tara:strand:+ start:320 stop:565 length:246 start_codon:yes stop_codon:yes gene_type:complete